MVGARASVGMIEATWAAAVALAPWCVKMKHDLSPNPRKRPPARKAERGDTGWAPLHGTQQIADKATSSKDFDCRNAPEDSGLPTGGTKAMIENEQRHATSSKDFDCQNVPEDSGLSRGGTRAMRQIEQRHATSSKNFDCQNAPEGAMRQVEQRHATSSKNFDCQNAPEDSGLPKGGTKAMIQTEQRHATRSKDFGCHIPPEDSGLSTGDTMASVQIEQKPVANDMCLYLPPNRSDAKRVTIAIVRER